jgi:hypothetical protein
VIMKGKKIDNLYKLLENVIGGTVGSTLAEPDTDNMVLWHTQLGSLGH